MTALDQDDEVCDHPHIVYFDRVFCKKCWAILILKRGELQETRRYLPLDERGHWMEKPA